MVTIRRQLISDTSMKFGRSNPKRFLTIHETGNTSRGANAAAHANLQSRLWDWATWHWSVDDREAVQSYAHDFQLWHAGDGRGHGNLSSIAIEACVNSDGDVAKMRRNLVALAGRIVAEEGIPRANIVQHNHWSGKNCPTFIRRDGVWSQLVADIWAEAERIRKGDAKPAPEPAPKPAPPARKSVGELAAEVWAGDWGNDPQRSQRLRDAGYDPAAVQAEVNRRYYGGSSKPTPRPVPSLAQIALEVYRGDWGNDPARSQRLRAAGYDPAAVQAEVDRRYYGATPAAPARPAGKTLAQIALEVFRGDWGNDPVRSQRLRAAGHDPAAVQAEVNRRYYSGGNR